METGDAALNNWQLILTFVRVDGTEGEVLGRGLTRGQHVEERRLAAEGKEAAAG